MEINKRFIKLFLMSCLLVILTMGCSGNNESTSSTDKGKQSNDSESTKQSAGGTLNVAISAQPNTLDSHLVSEHVTRDSARHIYETLVGLNENYEVAPLLAEEYSISDDGRTYSFKLREGVMFHNGEEMKADDVIASMEKWTKDFSIAKTALGEHEWVKKDDYNIELRVEKPSSVLLYILAEVDRMAAIMPKSIIDGAGPEGVKEFIGTGPFKLEEWKKDQFIHFTKFEDYQPLDTPPSGFTGKKEAKVDDLYFHFVPEQSTRVTGLLNGQYDFLHQVPYDSLDQLKSNPNLEYETFKFGFLTTVLNKKEGPFSDNKVRKALNTAMDNAEILTAAYTDEEFFELDPGIMFKEQTNWYTDSGKENYNQNDLEKAKKLLDESSYNGEEIVILTSKEYTHLYNAAIATQQQLEELGMKVKLDVYDFPTLLDRREDPALWDIQYTAFPFKSTPQQFAFFDPNWNSWTDNPEFDRLLDEIEAEHDQEKAKEIFVELQKEFWDYLPVINVGKDLRVSSFNKKVEGYKDFIGPVFWNVSVNE